MNRLVIIGNGFDLAHGLPTSYKDFIEDYWKTVSENLYLNYKYEDHLFACNIQSLTSKFKSGLLKESDLKDLNSIKKLIVKYQSHTTYRFNNTFFSVINDIVGIEKWVDIEDLYYSQLKKIVRSATKDRLDSRLGWQKEQKKLVKVLNNDFDQLKLLLEKYLIERIEEGFVFSKDRAIQFLDIFKNDSYEDGALNKFLDELSGKGQKYIKDILNGIEYKFDTSQNSCENDPVKQQLFMDTCFLDFNYTSTVSEYVNELGKDYYKVNQIHGNLRNIQNPINFGFGDEMDKFYQEIEEKNDNEYLHNIKSFQYLHTSNYKNLLELIDNIPFQVYIMGHSCGLSDRTLLNTVFEHENCCSIKVFYYEQKDVEGKIISDNYTELTQNISRHFNDKKLMRSKIVNKTLCQPMPQIKLPLK
ncbi:AbiH family protein [Flavobacterium sp. 14A]|uniref:AbiH family protein n=1 Tax=Flavobacterium sp. 14A TaxID=2735896 RepID=UPI00156FD93B|nr:AbiH family protein [Flavobacterium sp. 14A]NRT13120.1 hypothetical protein [Flavobacterium sp. 14A]